MKLQHENIDIITKEHTLQKIEEKTITQKFREIIIIIQKFSKKNTHNFRKTRVKYNMQAIFKLSYNYILHINFAKV